MKRPRIPAKNSPTKYLVINIVPIPTSADNTKYEPMALKKEVKKTKKIICSNFTLYNLSKSKTFDIFKIQKAIKGQMVPNKISKKFGLSKKPAKIWPSKRPGIIDQPPIKTAMTLTALGRKIKFPTLELIEKIKSDSKNNKKKAVAIKMFFLKNQYTYMFKSIWLKY